MLARIGRAWDILAAAGAAAAATLWLAPTAIDKITTELITFFGIQAAVILPAMIFTAGILRPEGLSLPEARRYSEALRQQMTFWIVLLALDFLTVGWLILGKATAWTIAGTLPWLGWKFDVSIVLLAAVSFFGTLAVLRTIPFIRGVLSLQAVNSQLTEKAIQARDRERAASQAEAAKANPFKPPEGFGQVVGRH